MSPENIADRVRKVFLSSRQQTPEFTFNHLLQEVGSVEPDQLALVLAQLTLSKVLEKIIRVESPESHGGIGDFHSLTEIPNEIHDWRSDRMIEVGPENLTVIFRPGPEASRHAAR
jgi:hypothetical protein